MANVGTKDHEKTTPETSVRNGNLPQIEVNI